MDKFWKGIVEFLIGYVGFKQADRIPFPVGVVFSISLARCLTLSHLYLGAEVNVN